MTALSQFDTQYPLVGHWMCSVHGVVSEDRKYVADPHSLIVSITILDDTKKYCMKCIAEFMAKYFCELKYVEAQQ